jgi:hypothetical protein
VPAKPKKEKREGNIPMMARMLVAGASDEEILAAFSERYLAQKVDHKQGAWIAQRVAIYRSIAMKDPKVAAVVEAREGKAKKRGEG